MDWSQWEKIPHSWPLPTPSKDDSKEQKSDIYCMNENKHDRNPDSLLNYSEVKKERVQIRFGKDYMNEDVIDGTREPNR
jgi:hypothetical protein